MTKAEIINKIAEDTGLPKKDVSATVEAFMEEIRDCMAVRKENVYLRGFGTFIVVPSSRHLRIWRQQPTVRTSSGQTCMPVWLRRPVKRASTRLRRSLRVWPRSRRSTRSAIASCSIILIRNACSRRTTTSSGSARTADISSSARRLPRSVPSATIRRPTSRSRQRTINPCISPRK